MCLHNSQINWFSQHIVSGCSHFTTCICCISFLCHVSDYSAISDVLTNTKIQEPSNKSTIHYTPKGKLLPI